MKTFRMIGMALVAVMLGFTMSSCDNDDDEVNPYKDYPQLIVGKWFCFTPESSIFMNYQADGTFYQVGYASKNGWREYVGTYEQYLLQMHSHSHIEYYLESNLVLTTDLVKRLQSIDVNYLV